MTTRGRGGHEPGLRHRERRLRTAAVVLAVLVVAGCTVHDGATAPVRGDGPPTIALLLPESKTSRYEGVDRPEFVRAVTELCAECEVVYANAGGDAARQQEQAEAVLVRGIDVLVLDAVDAAAARGIVVAAAAQGVRVVAYDRFVEDAPVDYYVAYDGELVGALQGRAIVDAVGDVPEGAGILLVHGAAADPNAADLKTGVGRVLAGSDVPVLAQFDTPDWAPDKAQEWVEAQLTEYGPRVVGVYAANDGTAGGAISALRAAGRIPVPPVTGHDAELAAVQRIVSGDQTMTVHKHIAEQARTAADVAVRLARGEDVAAPVEVAGVPSVLLTPEAVTRDDVRALVEAGVHAVEDVCAGSYRTACAELGLITP